MTIHVIMSDRKKSNAHKFEGTPLKNLTHPSKRSRPSSDSDISQNVSQDLQDLSDLLDNLSQNEEIVEKVADLILKKPALKNSILDKLVSEVNNLKTRTLDIEDRLDNLEQYSRKLCLKLSGIPENKDEDTDVTVLNTVNNFILPPDQDKLDKLSICNSHRIGSPH